MSIGGLKVEFDEHFKNRITMLCHVPKMEETKLGRRLWGRGVQRRLGRSFSRLGRRRR